jgi:two-component system response regulator YesN
MLKIVIADDEAAMRDLLIKRINGSGKRYHVCGVAENGRDALEMVKSFSPEILITDICMPVLDGLELAGEACKQDKNIKILIISGYDDFSYAQKAIGLGVSDYLLKPFLPEELFAVLDKAADEIEDRKNLYADKEDRIFAKHLGDQEEKLLIRIEMGSTEEAGEILDAILDKCAEMSKPEYENYIFIILVEIVISVSALVEKRLGSSLSWQDNKLLIRLKELFSHGFSRRNFSDLQDMIRGYVNICCEKIAGAGKSRGERIVFSVKELIERHIGDEDFNMETAAGLVYISPSYLRQIFKQVTGESFMEYLIRRRMETAGKLLLKPEGKIRDVAEQTGYSNQRYFAGCFKKYYHYTPTEYRKKYFPSADIH